MSTPDTASDRSISLKALTRLRARAYSNRYSHTVVLGRQYPSLLICATHGDKLNKRPERARVTGPLNGRNWVFVLAALS